MILSSENLLLQIIFPKTHPLAQQYSVSIHLDFDTYRNTELTEGSTSLYKSWLDVQMWAVENSERYVFFRNMIAKPGCTKCKHALHHHEELQYLYEQLQLFNYFHFVASCLYVMIICPLKFMLLQALVQQST